MTEGTDKKTSDLTAQVLLGLGLTAAAVAAWAFYKRGGFMGDGSSRGPGAPMAGPPYTPASDTRTMPGDFGGGSGGSADPAGGSGGAGPINVNVSIPNLPGTGAGAAPGQTPGQPTVYYNPQGQPLSVIPGPPSTGGQPLIVGPLFRPSVNLINPLGLKTPDQQASTLAALSSQSGTKSTSPVFTPPTIQSSADLAAKTQASAYQQANAAASAFTKLFGALNAGGQGGAQGAQGQGVQTQTTSAAATPAANPSGGAPGLGMSHMSLASMLKK